MNPIEALVGEFQFEIKSTRALLALCDAKDFDWKPHPKSMSLQQLAVHIAEIPTWLTTTLTTTELDFAKAPYRPAKPATSAELLAFFDANCAAALETLRKTKESDLGVNWSLRQGEKIFFTQPRAGVLRGFCYSHLIHHRGQLTVYLRLLNIPLPQVYGPSADNPDM